MKKSLRLGPLLFLFVFPASAQTDVRAYHARPLPNPAGLFSATLTAGSNKVTSSNGDFVVDDGVVIPKAGLPTPQATPGAPTIINWSGVTGTGKVSYECVGADQYEGLTAASLPATYTNAPAFGANVFAISAISRDGTGKITLTTTAPVPLIDYGGGNNFTPEVVQIWGVRPMDLDGWFTVKSVSGNTLTLLSGTSGRETGANTTWPYGWGGQMQLQVWPALVVKCPALVVNGPTTHYYVYADYGGGFALIGSTGEFGWSAAPFSGTTWQSSTFVDWGPFFNHGYQPPPGAQVPATPPTARQNQMLVTVVQAVAQANHTAIYALAQAPDISGTSYLLHDESVQVENAASRGGGRLVFPPGENGYVFNAPTWINAGGNGSTWEIDAPILANEPIVAQGQSVKIRSKAAIGGGLRNTMVISGVANPMLAAPQTSMDIGGIDFRPTSAGQLAVYLGFFENKVCEDRFETSYDTTILAFVNGGFADHFCDIQWSAGTQLPNNAGASIGIPNFTPPIPAFLFDGEDILFDGINYGAMRGIGLGGDGQWYGSGGTHVRVENVETFQSPWTPLVLVFGRYGLRRLDIENSTMDSNFQPVFSNLGCDICIGADFTLRGNLTTGNVPQVTGDPINVNSN